MGPVLFTQNSERELQLPDVQVDEAHPFVSTIARIAPSSDWFSGFSYFDARDVSANAWYQEFSVETFPWDAGTVNDNFASEVASISAHSTDRLGSFVSDDGSTVLPVVRWTCTLQAPPALSVAPSASPSTEPSVKAYAERIVCLQEGEQCSSHADCCSGGVCFQTCIFKKVPGFDVTSREQFRIPGPDPTSMLRGSGP
jgi:hypothetical protein